MTAQTIVTINGLAVNDSNFTAGFPDDGGHSFFNAPPKKVNLIERAGRPPLLGNVQGGPKIFDVEFECKGTFTTQWDTLKTALFDGDELIEMTLSDASGTWSLWVVPQDNPRVITSGVVYTMVAPDPAALLAQSSNWSPTASNQTKTFTVAGNISTRPVITLTPTAIKGGYGFQKMQFSTIYNPNAWRMNYYMFDITHNAALNTAALIQDATVSNQINNVAGIAAGATSIAIDAAVGGGLPNRGMGWLAGYGAQIAWTGNSGTLLTGVTWNVGGTTSTGTYADNTVIKRSQMMANGDDLQIFMNGVAVPRWFGGGGINSTTTLIFINLNLAIKRELTLSTALGAGALTEISFALTNANRTTLTAMAAKGKLKIENELFTYTGRTISATSLKVTGVSRHQFNTSAATHAAGLTVRWIEHTIWMCYGKQTAQTPTQAETRKPIMNMTSSTNLSWVLNEFTSSSGLRSGSLTPAVVAGRGSECYTGSHGADADPGTEAGMNMLVWEKNGQTQGETATLVWNYYDPAGVTTVSSNGDKYRASTNWPTLASLQKSTNGSVWATQWTQTTPGSAASWTAWTKNAEALGATYQHLRFILQGSLPAKANNQAALEVQAMTLTKDSSRIPQGSLGTVLDNYNLDVTLTNQITGYSFSLQFAMELNESLEIDCENKSVTYLKNNQRYDGALSNQVTGEWALNAPGSNTWLIEEDGLAGMDVDFAWDARSI